MTNENQTPVEPSTQAKPSVQELTAWYNEEIALATLRYRLTKLQSKTVIQEAKRLQAMAVIAQFKAPLNKPEDKQPSEEVS